MTRLCWGPASIDLSGMFQSSSSTRKERWQRSSKAILAKPITTIGLKITLLTPSSRFQWLLELPGICKLVQTLKFRIQSTSDKNRPKVAESSIHPQSDFNLIGTCAKWAHLGLVLRRLCLRLNSTQTELSITHYPLLRCQYLNSKWTHSCKCNKQRERERESLWRIFMIITGR